MSQIEGETAELLPRVDPADTWDLEQRSSIIVGGLEAQITASLVQMVGLMPRVIEQQFVNKMPITPGEPDRDMNVRVGWVPLAYRDHDEVRADVNSVLNQFGRVMRASNSDTYLETALLNDMILEQRVANAAIQPYQRTQYLIDLMSGQQPLPGVMISEQAADDGSQSLQLKFVPNLWPDTSVETSQSS